MSNRSLPPVPTMNHCGRIMWVEPMSCHPFERQNKYEDNMIYSSLLKFSVIKQERIDESADLPRAKPAVHADYGIRCLILLGAMIFLSGCSGGLRTEQITGTVTLDGQPLENASVAFSPKVEGEGVAGYGMTDKNGQYTIQTHQGKPNGGTTKGEYFVTITKTETVGTGKFYPALPGQSASEIMKVNHLTPQVYANTSTTPFNATIKRGKNELNFELSSSAQPVKNK